MLTNVYTQILDTDSKLHFALLRLQLIEKVRRGDPDSKDDLLDAINFANKQLAPRAKQSEEFVKELEKGMALLIFPRAKLPAQLKALLEPSLRLEIATLVNDSLLRREGSQRESQIKRLIKVRQWSEQECRKTQKPIPGRLPLGLTADEEKEDGDGDAMES